MSYLSSFNLIYLKVHFKVGEIFLYLEEEVTRFDYERQSNFNYQTDDYDGSKNKYFKKLAAAGVKLKKFFSLLLSLYFHFLQVIDATMQVQTLRTSSFWLKNVPDETKMKIKRDIPDSL